MEAGLAMKVDIEQVSVAMKPDPEDEPCEGKQATLVVKAMDWILQLRAVKGPVQKERPLPPKPQNPLIHEAKFLEILK